MQTNPKYFEDFFKSLRRRRARKVFLTVLRRLLLFIIVFLFLIYFLLQLSPVQNWIVAKGTEYLSEELNTTVSIKEIDFKFFDRLIVRDFYIEDLKGDTLLHTKTLETSMSANLIALLSKRVDLDNIKIDGTKINLSIEQGDTKTNLQHLFANIKNQKVAEAPYLDLQKIEITNVDFSNKNKPKGFYQFYHLPVGRISVDKLDIANNHFVFKLIEIDAPDVVLELHPQNLVEIPEDLDDTATDVQSDTLIFDVEKLDLGNGKFALNNYRKGKFKTSPDTIIDYQFLRADQIVLRAENLNFNGPDFNCSLEQLALKESSGFELKKMSAEQVAVDKRSVSFYDMDLITPNSTLGDTLVFKFREWTDLEEFNDKVLIDARFLNSEVALKDIMAFVPKLRENAFFQKNRNKKAQIDGRIQGRTNNLRGKNLKIVLDESTQFYGNFNSRNLTIKQEEVLNLQIDRLLTDIQTLKLLVPNFNPPANFEKLGKLDFNGRFDGFFVDFVAFGALKSDLGEAELDMRMDLREGRGGARYSGELSLNSFDLGRWTDNPDFGRVSFQSKVEEGYGLNIDNIDTELTAVIDDFSFKGYNYENADINGRFSKNLFDGDLTINDKHVDFDFAGAITFGDSIPTFDFTANVEHIDFNAINITKQPFSFTGNVDLNIVDDKIATLTGNASGSDLKLTIPNGDTLSLDTAYIFTTLSSDNIRDLRFESEILQAVVQGKYVLDEIPQAISAYLIDNYPSISRRLNVKQPEQNIAETYFNYDISVPDSKNFLTLLDDKIGAIKDLKLQGNFNSLENELLIDLDLPRFTYANFDLKEILFSLEGTEELSDLYFEVNESKINNLQLEPLTLRGQIIEDVLDFQFNALSWTSILDNLQLKGSLEVTDDFFKLKFLPSDLVVLREPWTIGENNQLLFDKGFVEVTDFNLGNGDQSFSLRTEGDQGLRATVRNFKFSIIDQYWDYDKLDFDGKFNIDFVTNNLYELKDLNLDLYSDTLLVNGEDWGVFRVDAQADAITDPADIYMSITRQEGQLTLEGQLLPAAKTKDNPNKAVPQLDFDLTVDRYPLHILEYWLSNGISNTSGNFDLYVKFDGPLNRPNMNGDIRIYDAATTIDVLQTRYFIDNEKAKLTNNYIDATGGLVRDSIGNIAVVEGGLTHDHIKNMGLDATLTSQNFLSLNTKKEDNDLFYGQALANGFVRFTGSFRQPNIFINAAPNTGTRIVIPISESQDVGAVDFIEFINNRDSSEVIQNTLSELLGVQMEMRLAMNETADMQLVFDEKTGDIIQGRGEGDIQMNLNRNGDFTMTGNYTISEGQYLFTAFNVINKPFEVKEGGTIRWSGDPYNADIVIVAEYSRLRTSLYNFISEYLGGETALIEDLVSEARDATEVDLKMNLTGKLLRPDIDFELSFPDVSPALRNFVDSKMRILSQDPADLNRQVFGLMVLGSFLPSSTATDVVVDGISGVAVNTFTEFLSSQLSLFLTDIVSGAIQDGGAISGFQLDVSVNQYNSTSISNFQDQSEIGLRPKLLFFNDRLSIEAGGGVSFVGDFGTFFGQDVAIEYSISRDRRLKARITQKTDNSVFGNRNSFGAGLTYRREGDTFKELFARTKSKKAKKKKEQKPDLTPQTKNNN